MVTTIMKTMIGLTISVAAALLLTSSSEALNDTKECRRDLGMYSGEIKDDGITASSSYDEKSVGPLNARIRTERNGGAWCPKNPISRNVYEWLQIDLRSLHFISQVETQGRFGNGQGQEYAPTYMIEYQRATGEQWLRYKDRKGSEILKGNSNTYLAELRELHPPIIARAVRFIPYSSHPRTICMRVEVYGCEWTDGVTSYEMRQGDRRGGGDLDFSDFTYDGHQNSSGFLVGGLGQLTDREVGNPQFRLDVQFIGKRGYEWMAWKRDDASEDFVEIIFRFDAVRRFNEVRIHTNNMFSKEIGVFRETRVYFSIGGHYYNGDPAEYKNERDIHVEEAKYIKIPISHRIGRHVKLQLFFDSRWIMISEVQFDSDILGEAVAAEIEPLTAATTQIPEIQTIVLDSGSKSRAILTNPGLDTTTLTELTIQAADGQNIDHRYHDPGTNAPSMARSQKDSLIGILLGTFVAVFVVVTVTGFIILVRHRRKKCNSPLKSLFIEDHVNFNLNYLSQGGKILKGHMYNSIACSDFTDSTKDTALCAEKVQAADTQPDVGSPYSTLPEIFHFQNDDASAFSIKPTVQGSIPIGATNLIDNKQVINITPDRLRLISRLGAGTFGEVQICEAFDLPTEKFSSQCLPQSGRGVILVVARTLRAEASEKERRDFDDEIQLLSSLMDANLAQMFGVIRAEGLWAIVTEYTALGNLREFLSQRSLDIGSTHHRTLTLSHGCLIYMATQIASGMKYLESVNLVHRDLACRNCLVGHGFVVKISDYGTGPVTYPEDYYRIDGSTDQPLRWMSWEAVLLQKFSCKSDVWSFGVALWEIMSLVKTRPFSELTNDQVISNLGHYYRSDGLERHLSQPVGCSKEIYDLMAECWRRDVAKRPAFHEIHMFLSRKNLGYTPILEQPNCCELTQYTLQRV